MFKNGDFKRGTFIDVNGNEESTGQPSSDVLYYVLENDDKIVVRPSGTEPKIKIYILAHSDDATDLARKCEAYACDARAITEA